MTWGCSSEKRRQWSPRTNPRYLSAASRNNRAQRVQWNSTVRVAAALGLVRHSTAAPGSAPEGCIAVREWKAKDLGPKHEQFTPLLWSTADGPASTQPLGHSLFSPGQAPVARLCCTETLEVAGSVRKDWGLLYRLCEPASLQTSLGRGASGTWDISTFLIPGLPLRPRRIPKIPRDRTSLGRTVAAHRVAPGSSRIVWAPDGSGHPSPFSPCPSISTHSYHLLHTQSHTAQLVGSNWALFAFLENLHTTHLDQDSPLSVVSERPHWRSKENISLWRSLGEGHSFPHHMVKKIFFFFFSYQQMSENCYFLCYFLFFFFFWFTNCLRQEGNPVIFPEP